MTPFRRRPAPGLWLELEAQWRAKGASMSARDALHGWQRDKQPIARLFHASVRSEEEPRLCAYCDGDLGPTSPETIDHFIPESKCRSLGLAELGLAWMNLFPACTTCNSMWKRDRWSCLLLRPDADPVDTYFSFNALTGELYPSPEASRVEQARVRKTIHILGLNEATRCQARKRLLRHLRNAEKAQDHEEVEKLAQGGPYRFVARFFRSSIEPA